ncbi:MAG: hypothetical protein ACI9UT_002814 [Flavobacteriales bacterium]|jgi:hypothetical protein
MAESQGRTLSDACRELVEGLAEEQRKTMSHNAWLSQQINAAFDKFDNAKANFIVHGEAKTLMEVRRQKIRNRDKS